jgi:hypothetical protein
VREEIDSALRLSFSRPGCVRAVGDPGTADPAADSLVLRAVVDDYSEQTSWDIGMTARTQPMGGHDPVMDSRVIVDVTVGVELRVGADTSAVRAKTVPVHLSRSPHMPGEDLVAALRAELVDKVVRETHALVCKGSRKKLTRDIERVRAAR